MHERPNLKAGSSNNPVLGGPDRYWDINAFELQPAGERGNLGQEHTDWSRAGQSRFFAREIV